MRIRIERRNCMCVGCHFLFYKDELDRFGYCDSCVEEMILEELKKMGLIGDDE